MTEDPLNIGEQVALRIILAMPKGPAITAEWTWNEVLNAETPQWIHAGPPSWLKEPEMDWRGRRLPIVVRGNVPVGMEQHARDLLLGRQGEEDSSD